MFSWDLNPKRVDYKRERWLLDKKLRKTTYFPLINSKMRMPSDQQSAAISWPLFRMISGATYSERRRAGRLETSSRYERRTTYQVCRKMSMSFVRVRLSWQNQNQPAKNAQISSGSSRSTTIYSHWQVSSILISRWILSRLYRTFDAVDWFLSRGDCLCVIVIDVLLTHINHKQ